MVRAILDGTKSQTRRVCKNRVYGNGFMVGGRELLCHNDYLPPSALLMDYRSGGHDFTTSNMEGWGEACPYGQPGDRLWVRETWRHLEGGAVYDAAGGVMDSFEPETMYRADRPHYRGPWKPAIHMPRWASRITLEITGVRVERLQDISPADCEEEGVQQLPLQEDAPNPWYTADIDAGSVLHSRSAIGAYHKLWEAINRPGSWDANPWVWVVEFKRLEAA